MLPSLTGFMQGNLSIKYYQCSKRFKCDVISRLRFSSKAAEVYLESTVEPCDHIHSVLDLPNPQLPVLSPPLPASLPLPHTSEHPETEIETESVPGQFAAAPPRSDSLPYTRSGSSSSSALKAAMSTSSSSSSSSSSAAPPPPPQSSSSSSSDGYLSEGCFGSYVATEALPGIPSHSIHAFHVFLYPCFPVFRSPSVLPSSTSTSQLSRLDACPV